MRTPAPWSSTSARRPSGTPSRHKVASLVPIIQAPPLFSSAAGGLSRPAFFPLSTLSPLIFCTRGIPELYGIPIHPDLSVRFHLCRGSARKSPRQLLERTSNSSKRTADTSGVGEYLLAALEVRSEKNRDLVAAELMPVCVTDRQSDVSEKEKKNRPAGRPRARTALSPNSARSPFFPLCQLLHSEDRYVRPSLSLGQGLDHPRLRCASLSLSPFFSILCPLRQTIAFDHVRPDPRAVHRLRRHG